MQLPSIHPPFAFINLNKQFRVHQSSSEPGFFAAGASTRTRTRWRPHRHHPDFTVPTCPQLQIESINYFPGTFDTRCPSSPCARSTEPTIQHISLPQPTQPMPVARPIVPCTVLGRLTLRKSRPDCRSRQIEGLGSLFGAAAPRSDSQSLWDLSASLLKVK